MFGFLIDRVGRYQLEEFFECSYLPLQRILPEILIEEIGHIGFGTNQTAELASKNEEARQRVQRGLDFWYIKALDMFGRTVLGCAVARRLGHSNRIFWLFPDERCQGWHRSHI